MKICNGCNVYVYFEKHNFEMVDENGQNRAID